MPYSVGVRELVEFILKSGDLSAGGLQSPNSALEGTKIHQAIQATWPSETECEVDLKQTVNLANQSVLIHGRADGLKKADNHYTEVLEIKSSAPSFADLKENTLTLYWAQAKIYAQLLMQADPSLNKLDLTLIYVQVTTGYQWQKTQSITRKEAQTFFDQVTNEYAKWLQLKQDLANRQQEMLTKLKFPFPNYRQNQRELAAVVYKTILNQKKLFVQAPTGTGKTISTIFPALKAMGQGKINRLFYLTAKQSTRQVAQDTLNLLAQSEPLVTTITLTAKDQITFEEEKDLADEENPYLLGYYDRIKPALMDILRNEWLITKELVCKYARKHQVDPFEYSLDISLFCSVIICDYNYLFDPMVYLQRFFSKPDDSNCFLIDEAHNLVARSRDMYTKEISLQTLTTLKDKLKQTSGHRGLINRLQPIIATLTELKQTLVKHHQPYLVMEDELIELAKSCRKFCDFTSNWLREHPEETLAEEILTVFFDLYSYLKVGEFYDPSFRTKLSTEADDLLVKIFCLNPSKLLAKSMALGGSSILFSATLSPLAYYQEVLGGTDSLCYQLPSPFDQERLGLVITANIATTYRQRQASLDAVVATIASLSQSKSGNYLVFLPSYAYLTQVVTAFNQRYPLVRTIIQQPEMTAKERSEFLANFKPTKESLVAFALLGGIFSEGIDLKGDCLNGVAIIGVGLPGISPENDALRTYFDHQEKAGFEYAYQLPGLNNVFQAAGRLIRSASDYGPVILVDSRFASNRYQRFYPNHWSHGRIVYNTTQLQEYLASFWQKFTS